MKKNLSYAVLLVMAFASCTNVEVVELKQDAIEFAAWTSNVSRSEVTTANLMDFQTMAIRTSDSSTFLKTTVSRTNASSDWTYSPTMYWPMESLGLDFYSIAPARAENDVYSSIDWTNKKVQYISTGLNTNGSASQIENLDLCYAVNRGQTKDDGTVNVKFQHALSQIAFQLKCTQEDLYVKVNSVHIEGIYDRGTYIFAGADTGCDEPIKGVWSGLNADYSPAGFFGINKGTYKTEGVANYAYLEYENVVEMNGEVTTPVKFVVTAEDIATSEYRYSPQGYTPISEPSLFVIPQTITPGTTIKNGDEVTRSGAFLVVNCAISQRDQSGNSDWLWCEREVMPPYQCLPIYLPLTAPNNNTWEEGKRYVYTIVFGGGVLEPISFTTEVKDFEEAPEQEIDAEVPSK